jgi:hypothetical protein
MVVGYLLIGIVSGLAAVLIAVPTGAVTTIFGALAVYSVVQVLTVLLVAYGVTRNQDLS